MYSLEEGLREILRLADMPNKDVDLDLLNRKIVEFASVLERQPDVPSALVEMMPSEMKKACVIAGISALLIAIAENTRARK